MTYVTKKTKTRTIAAGNRDVIPLLEGMSLNVVGSAGAAGTVNLVDPALGGANYTKTYTVGAGSISPIGPMAGSQKFVVICTAGSIDATVGDAVLGAAQVATLPSGAPAYAIDSTAAANMQNAQQLPIWRLALARVLAGKGDARLACDGDSTFTGLGGGAGSAGYANSRVKAIPYQLAALFTAYGIPARADGIYGDNNSGANLAAYDTRLTLNGWAAYSDLSAPGGNPIYATTGNTASLSIAFENAIDTLEITFRRNPGFGQITVNIDGGAALTPTVGGTGALVDTSGTAGIGYAKFTFAKGVHVVNIQRNNVGSDVRLLSIVPNDSTFSKVVIANLGISGAKVGQFEAVTVPTKAAAIYTDANGIKPHLTANLYGINDQRGTPTSIPAFTASYQNRINVANTAFSDSINIIGTPTDTADTPLATQQLFYQAIYSVSAANNKPVRDFVALFGSYAQANAAGEMYDPVHPNDLGYADQARYLFKALVAV